MGCCNPLGNQFYTRILKSKHKQLHWISTLPHIDLGQWLWWLRMVKIPPPYLILSLSLKSDLGLYEDQHHNFHRDRAQDSYSMPMVSCRHILRKDFACEIHSTWFYTTLLDNMSKIFNWILFPLHTRLTQRPFLFQGSVHVHSCSRELFSRGESVRN